MGRVNVFRSLCTGPLEGTRVGVFEGHRERHWDARNSERAEGGRQGASGASPLTIVEGGNQEGPVIYFRHGDWWETQIIFLAISLST